MNDGDSVRAVLKLWLADGVGALTFRRLIKAFGSARRAAEAGPAGWRRVQGIGEKTARAIADVTDDRVDDEIAEAEARGVRIVPADSDDFPAALRPLPDCPPLLYVRGELAGTDAVALGIVGSRRCTQYGLEQGERFGQLLARAGFTVVSGGARGIDTAAHRGALAAGGRTLAVMGRGLGGIYPPENARLFDRIVDEGRGALLAELPMRIGVHARNFPLRNRIISGLSLGVLLVEAARRSGAMLTARAALEQNREVFAIPGRVDSPMSGGTNELIASGSAALVQNLDDILDQLGEVGAAMTPPEESPADLLAAADLGDDERAVAAVLAESELGVDDIARRCELPAARATAALTMLVVRGLVAQHPGQVYSLKRRQN